MLATGFMNRADTTRPRPHGTLWVLGACATLLALPPAWGQGQQRVQGEWINLPGEITSEAFTQFKIDTERAIKNGARVLIYHFQSAEASNFGPCLDLANYLLDKIEARVETIAYVDKPLYGNAVLPVLACNKVYLLAGDGRAEASLGFNNAALDKTQPLDRTKLQAYLNLAERRGRPAALVLKMLDPGLIVYQFEANGRRFKLDAAGVERLGLPENLALTADEQRLQPQVFSPAGKIGNYGAREAEQVGLINRTVGSAQMLVERLGLPPAVLKGNLLGITNPKAAVIEVVDEIDGGTIEMVMRKVNKAIDGEKVNCIILQISATGGLGSVDKAAQLGRQFRDRCKAADVLTVAYCPRSCEGAANYLAFACDQIVLGPDCTLGDCRSLVFEKPGSKTLNDETEVRDAKQDLIALAEPQFYSNVLIRGFFELDLEILAARERPDVNRMGDGGVDSVVYLPRNEVRGNWEAVPGPPLKKPGQLLMLNDQLAVSTGFARAVLQTKDVEGVLALYGVRKEDTRMMRADWLDNLVELLRNEVMTVFLVIVGFTCIILELKSPGLTIPGVIAAVCFVLVFWSQSWLAGELNALAVLMFLLGIVLLGVEMFILPGFGITGVAGIVLMLLGLSLLMVKEWPQSQAEYERLGTKFAILAGGLVAAFVAGFSIAKFLPQVPMFNRLMLPAPDEETSDAAGSIPPAVPPDLLGQTGTAVTELRPAGKACFADQYIDVVLDGGFVDAGTRVQVIEIDGLRVVVKAV